MHDQLTGELNIAWVHLGVEGNAGIVEQADGTFRVDLALDGEIGANLGSKGAKGHARIGPASPRATSSTPWPTPRRSSTGCTRKLMPDVDLSVFAGPGGLMADTVEDVVEYLGDHSEQRSSFEAELRLEGEVDLTVGAFEVNVSERCQRRQYTSTAQDDALRRRRARGASIRRRGRGHHRQRRGRRPTSRWNSTDDDWATSASWPSAARSAARRRWASRRSLNGTNADFAQPETRVPPPPVGPTSASTPSFDLQDQIVQQRARPPQRHGQTVGWSMADLQALLRERGAPGRRHSSSRTAGTSASPAWRSSRAGANAFTWVKPPGGDFTHVGYGELREDRADV